MTAPQRPQPPQQPGGEQPHAPAPPAMPPPGPPAMPPQPPAMPPQPLAAQAPPAPPAAPAAPNEPQFQSYYQQENVDDRPCLACGGTLVFDIDVQALKCPHCGSVEQIVHAPDAAVEENSIRKAMAASHGMGDRLTKYEGEKEIICQACGGHTTFTGTFTSTRCPYCATPIQRTDVHDAPDRLAVDGVLPFQVSEPQAKEILEKWVNGRWFAPNEFKKYSTHGSFSSVYTAYFTFDAQATTDYTGQRGTNHTRTVGSGDNKRTVTEIRWHGARGRVFNSFDDLTVQGNTGLEKRFVEQLEPWPTTNALQPFSLGYLAGHLSRTYDRNVEECFVEAQDKMQPQIDTSIRRDIGGDHQRINSKNTHLANVTYKHVLLPIWLLTVIYENQPWQVFINGATGEIHGQRPWSKVKIAAAIFAAIVIIAIVFAIRAATR